MIEPNSAPVAPQPEAAPAVPVVTDPRPWEVRWAEAQRRGPETQWERARRYGMAVTIEETKTHYLLRVELPEDVPEHPYKYKWDLPLKMPDYKFDVHLEKEGREIYLKGWFEDEKIGRLCGIANSFPDRFLRTLELPIPARDISTHYDPVARVLNIVVSKV